MASDNVAETIGRALIDARTVALRGNIDGAVHGALSDAIKRAIYGAIHDE